MKCSPPKLALGTLLLGSLAFAQAPPSKASSGIVSTKVDESGIQPDPIAANGESEPDSGLVADPASLLPDPTPVHSAKATLMGGVIERLDRIRDQITLRPFGGGNIKILFDPRTHVYRDGVSGTSSDLREGEHAHLDTILDDNSIFATSIRVKTTLNLGETRGVVLRYRSDQGELIVRDAISPAPVRVRLSSSTQLVQGDRSVASSVLVPGTLIAVKFNNEGNGRDAARKISILALPGTQYAFAGQVEYLDLRTRLVVLQSATDKKIYEIYLGPSVTPDDNLRIGAMVEATTSFDGSRYVAHDLAIHSQDK